MVGKDEGAFVKILRRSEEAPDVHLFFSSLFRLTVVIACLGKEGHVSSVGQLQGCWWLPPACTSSALIVSPWRGRDAPAAGNPDRCNLCQTL